MKLPNNVLIMFFAVSAIVLAIKFVRSKQWTLLTPSNLTSNIVPLIAAIVPTAVLILLSQVVDLNLYGAAPYFVGSALLAYALSQLGLDAELRSFTILIASVALTVLAPADACASEGALAGLLVWKAVENVLCRPESRLDDIAPAFVWLVSDYWAAAVLTPETGAKILSLILSTLTVSTFLRWVQTPLLKAEDRVFLKRLLLSITGGLTLLIIINKLLLDPNQARVAALAGGGFLLTYLLQVKDRDVDETAALPRGLQNIFLVGIATIAASRLFGMEGLLILAATAVVAPLPGSALLAGFFFSTRALEQTYIAKYNPNVTGINMLHPYVTAALYAGFLTVVVGSVLIHEIKDRRVLALVFVSSCILLPAGANYFLHAEPMGSLLITVSTCAVLAAMLAPAIFKNQSSGQENIILIPALLATFALLTDELLQRGEGATSHDKLVALGVLAFVVVCITLFSRFFKTEDKKAIAVANN